MANSTDSMASVYNDHGLLAKPLHIQRLEHAVQLHPFMNYVNNILNEPSNGESHSELDEVEDDLTSSKEGRSCDRTRFYNFGKVKKSRKWLKDVLLSDSSDPDGSGESITEDDLQDMLKLHRLQKTAQAEFQVNPELKQYQYYSTGLLSNYDKFYDHQKLVLGGKKKVKEKGVEKRKVKKKKGDGEKSSKDGQEPGTKKREGKIKSEDPNSETPHSHRSKKKSAASHEAMMNLKRKRLYVALCKKEINRAYKQNVTAHKEVLTTAKKLALACQREVRKSALQSQKVTKDVPSRARRLTKEMMLYWKRYDKVEKEHRKKAEKEAQEQLRMDIELREAKRQQRKLNFLITQTELYAHFMSRKMPGLQDVQEEQILRQLDEAKNDAGSSFSLLGSLDDDYDCDEIKSLAMKNANEAYEAHMSQMSEFDSSLPPGVKTRIDSQAAFDGNFKLSNPTIKADEEHPQPAMFVGKLKTYQLKGMNWLYSLYDKGINGILADEMGLGKTVQTIAFLATLIKAQGIWGPFLIIAPASTLHNWQQEFTKFVPKFKVLPYWGNTSDRKILRKFWTQKDLHTENASFHVLITSYQLVVQDVKYFQRIKWQYMVLDEAQAIKSTSSVRWKILLGFNCRNRLLLTGTPIQNSMAELWALLHFIMPTLFDSHDEFNEWFSKDIESHAENKSVIDEKHLSRLHKILKPFMLRRVKKDVENELSEKIEILMYCQLTQRQKLLYQNLRNKISIDELMQSSSTSSSAQSATSSLLNLVMQFRKVCNHPDLFERREVKHPFFMRMETIFLSKMFFREGLLHLNNSSQESLLNKLGIFCPEYIHHNLFPQSVVKCDQFQSFCFSFSRFVNLSPGELSRIFYDGLLARWNAAYLDWKSTYRIRHRNFWNFPSRTKFMQHEDFIIAPLSSVFSLQVNSGALPPLLFTDSVSDMFGFVDYIVRSRLDRSPSCSSKIVEIRSEIQLNNEALPDIKPKMLRCQPSTYPTFLTEFTPKVVAVPFSIYSPDNSANRWHLRQRHCGSPEAFWTIQLGCHITKPSDIYPDRLQFHPEPAGGISAFRPANGWSGIKIPNKETLVTDSGKLTVLDNLLNKLKMDGHRVLIYSQMTKMIDLLEEYMWHRKHTYIRLDGSSKISDRRDMVADFQARSDIFVFLLSTRAGGLGINLTAADTVIFYDSDWNPTVDQQAMDRAHRLGQTKQVTVYRLVCKGSIEERILQRAREKSEIQRMVISGGNFKPDTLKPKEVVSLLLDDDELERKFRIRQEERKQMEKFSLDRKRKIEPPSESKRGGKRKRKYEENVTIPANVSSSNQDGDSAHSADSIPPSPYSEHSVSSLVIAQDDNSSDGPLIVDDASLSSTPISFNTSLLGKSEREGSNSPVGLLPQLKKRGGTGRSRGRPRGSGRRLNGRGRGNLLATAAAELAGAQAGKSAAFAAYGYALSGAKSVGNSSPVQNNNGLSRGSRGAARGVSALSARSLSSRARNSYRGGQNSFPSKSISLGFYMPGPQT